jgi:hypothetical protein
MFELVQKCDVMLRSLKLIMCMVRRRFTAEGGHQENKRLVLDATLSLSEARVCKIDRNR